MVRKFECKSCKCRFEAEDNNQVICPSCHSDNVEYAHFHVPVKVWKIAGAVLALLLIIYVLVQFDWNTSSNSENSLEDGADSLAYQIDSTYIEETGLSLPPVINVGDLSFENNGYSFEVSIENPPAVKCYVAVLDAYNAKKVVAKSSNGKFKDVPFSEADGGYYNIALFDASADTLICSIEKTGFIKQKAVAKKMTVADLQARINQRDPSLMGVGENDNLNPEYKLKFVGLPSDAMNVPTTLGEVFDKLDNEIWSSVKVNSLDYDDMNRISVINLTVKE